MTLKGTYQKLNEKGQLVTRTLVCFENTGIKEHGKVVWRKLNKDGTPSNDFAEQCEPNVPWARGKWFLKINSAVVLRQYPQLKVETERSKTMNDEEYLAFLDSRYFG